MRRFERILSLVTIGVILVTASSFAWGKKGKKMKQQKAVKNKASEAPFIYNSHGKKDPMLPVVDSNGTVLFVEEKNTGKATVNMKIQGIIFKNQGESKVMIQGAMYKEGDKIGMVTIKKINRDNIIVSDGMKEYKVEI